MLDASKILTGMPDQMVTGTILSAPLGTPLPTSSTDPLDKKDWRDSGFISEDGISLKADRSFDDIKDWAGKVRRRLVSESSLTVEFSFLSFDIYALNEVFGEENVEVSPATKDKAEQVSVKITADTLRHKSYVINLKDGQNRLRIVIPEGEIITDSIEMSFKAGEPILLPAKISAYPNIDEGVFAKIYWDDGKKTEVVNA
ncbi:MAG: hypothetical protein LBI63_01770 [Candidatus Ancillula sp.]|jgi:hypothetical protein|nr:hypothetical protein [Candidatus Ancillula sp.]